MSKLSEALKLEETGRLNSGKNPPIVFADYRRDEVPDATPYGWVKEYSLHANFVVKNVLAHREFSNNEMMRDLKRAIIEEVFGEFRPYFTKLYLSLHQDRLDKTRNLLKEFEQKMFEVE